MQHSHKINENHSHGGENLNSHNAWMILTSNTTLSPLSFFQTFSCSTHCHHPPEAASQHYLPPPPHCEHQCCHQPTITALHSHHSHTSTASPPHLQPKMLPASPSPLPVVSWKLNKHDFGKMVKISGNF